MANLLLQNIQIITGFLFSLCRQPLVVSFIIFIMGLEPIGKAGLGGTKPI